MITRYKKLEVFIDAFSNKIWH